MRVTICLSRTDNDPTDAHKRSNVGMVLLALLACAIGWGLVLGSVISVAIGVGAGLVAFFAPVLLISVVRLGKPETEKTAAEPQGGAPDPQPASLEAS